MPNESDYVSSTHCWLSYILMSPNYGRLIRTLQYVFIITAVCQPRQPTVTTATEWSYTAGMHFNICMSDINQKSRH